jgi:DDE superfamily endonuclease
MTGRSPGRLERGAVDERGVCPDHAQTNDLKPWQQKQGVIPPQANAEFVCAMEDVLEVYTRPDDPQRPQVCVDETSKQLVAETRRPLPAAPGPPERVDYEYARKGTAKLFMVFEPLAGQRLVKVTARRTAVAFAQRLREVVDTPSAQAEKIVLVMDNLNTHTLASVYEAFEPAEARRLLERLELHDTPKHGRWLNRAETALSVLATQCLNRRIPDATTLSQEVAAWQAQRNAARCRVDWRFTTQDARIKLKRLYPSIQLG